MSAVRVFRIATAVLLVHALDDAIVGRQPGVPVDQHAWAAVAALVLGAAALVAFGRLRTGLQAGVAAVLGLLGAVNGAMHAGHLRAGGFDAADVSGVLALVAGLVLVGLAVALPVARRGQGGWRGRLVAVPAALLALLVVAPVAMAIVDSHKWREPIPAAPAGYEPVAFTATDGLELRGWFHPGRNGATVLVVHGGNGDRTGVLAHAGMLVRQGYAVLVYDARGRGDSEGSPSGFAWGWSKDANGALDYLAARPDVDPGRIAGLGVSSGADVLLEVAGDRPELRAVVADGAAAMTWEDSRRLGGGGLGSAAGWVMFRAIGVLTGDERPRVLEDRVAAMRAPLLLISAARAIEYDYNVLYERAAGGPVQHWNLPDVRHTDGLRARPAEYERRVGAFLDAELTGGGARP